MFRKYGIIGILMIIFAEINFILKIEPFAFWYFPIIWFGYIFVIDAIVYKLRHKSLISTRPKYFLLLLILSASFWWIFEFINMAVGNWSYGSIIGAELTLKPVLMATISFSTVLPAVFETAELIKSLHLFHKKLKKKHKISKKLLFAMIGAGLFCLIAPIIYPKYFCPLIWGSFFFLLEPINYLHKQPSILRQLENRNITTLLSLMFAGIIAGILWEFWNYWAAVKWHYVIPYVGFLKIFEMPILGYLGYPFFALELYAMYHFIRSLLKIKAIPLLKNL